MHGGFEIEERTPNGLVGGAGPGRRNLSFGFTPSQLSSMTFVQLLSAFDGYCSLSTSLLPKHYLAFLLPESKGIASMEVMPVSSGGLKQDKSELMGSGSCMRRMLSQRPLAN